MPIYEWRCCKCKEEWEAIYHRDRVECQECGSRVIRKKVSVPGYRRGQTTHGEQ